MPCSTRASTSKGCGTPWCQKAKRASGPRFPPQWTEQSSIALSVHLSESASGCTLSEARRGRVSFSEGFFESLSLLRQQRVSARDCFHPVHCTKRIISMTFGTEKLRFFQKCIL